MIKSFIKQVINTNIESFKEIFNDTFCLEYLFEIKRNLIEHEIKYFFSKFLATSIPIVIYELSIYLEKENILSKDKFYNENYQEIVKKKRHKFLKSNIHDQKHIQKLISAMGVSFSDPIYDLNITVSGDTLLDINFDLFDETNDLDEHFWNSLYSLIPDIANATIKAVFPGINCKDIFCELKEKISFTYGRIAKEFHPKRYSYSAYYLFKNANDLQLIDKLFILYRYRMLKSVSFLSKYIESFSLTYKTEERIILNAEFDYFIAKINSILIYTMGKDFEKLNTTFAKQIQEQLINKNVGDEFYQLNGQLKTNLHYCNIVEFSIDQMAYLREKQDCYIDTILSFIESAINVEINDEVKTVTDFTNECFAKGYNAKYILENYEDLYIEFIKNNK